VSREKCSFEGIEGVEEGIRKLAGELAYVAVWDRSDRKVEEPVGRFDFDPARAQPWREALRTEADRQNDDEPEGDEGEDVGLPGDDENDWRPPASPLACPPGDPAGTVRRLDAAALARACCLWLRELATRNTVGWPYRRFRVRLYGPKGLSTIDSGSFLCRNHAYMEEVDEAAVPRLRIPSIPAPAVGQPADRAVGRPMRALGEDYARWGHVVLGSVGQLQVVHDLLLNRLHRQLRESRDQVDQLVAAILESRLRDAVAREEAEAEERKGKVRAALARNALDQMGEAARAFLLGRGIHPEIAGAVAAMGASPDLVAALNDPEVKGLMRNPENLEILASMLRGAAAQARAARLVAEPSPAEAANGQPSPGASNAAA
jgi:hypothetical protein